MVRVEVLGYIVSIDVREKLTTYGGECILTNIKPKGGSSYNGLQRDTPPESGTFYRLEVYKRVGNSQAEV